MIVSIITPVYNNEKTIVDCVSSVSAQTYKQIEHVVVDGASTDETIDRISNFKLKIISEADNGIYDAMNKGINHSNGEIIGILNSDDLYYDNKVIEKVVATFNNTDCDIVYGDIVCVDQINLDRVVRYYRSITYTDRMFYNGGHPPHPGFFVKRKVYEEYGLFSLKYKISADYEFMLRVLEKNKVKSCYINETLVTMRIGGVSNNSLKSIIKNNFECRQAWLDNDLRPPAGLILKKPLSKVSQLFMRERGEK